MGLGGRHAPKITWGAGWFLEKQRLAADRKSPVDLESWESLEMSPRPETSKVLRIIPKANFPRNACELEIFNNLRFDFAKGIFFLRRNSPKPLRGDLIGERYCSIVSLQVP